MKNYRTQRRKLTGNNGTLLQFEMVFKLLTVVIAVPLFTGYERLILWASGYSYLTAENLLRQIQLHEHPEEGFAELGALAQAEYSSRTFFPGESGLPASVELAAVSLETGELSGLLETKEGFWLVCKKVLDPKAALAAWFDERLQTEASAAAVEISEELEQLDVERFYKELTRLREELPDAKTLPAQSAQAPSAQLPGDRSGAGSASGSEDSSASAADSSREEKESGSVIILPDGNGQPI